MYPSLYPTPSKTIPFYRYKKRINPLLKPFKADEFITSNPLVVGSIPTWDAKKINGFHDYVKPIFNFSCLMPNGAKALGDIFENAILMELPRSAASVAKGELFCPESERLRSNKLRSCLRKEGLELFIRVLRF